MRRYRDTHDYVESKAPFHLLQLDGMNADLGFKEKRIANEEGMQMYEPYPR